MPFESTLQTSFFPSQQFQDELSPQVFPGGLQAVPPLQRKSSVPLVSCRGAVGSFPIVSQKMSYPPERIASGEPPQQACVLSQ